MIPGTMSLLGEREVLETPAAPEKATTDRQLCLWPSCPWKATREVVIGATPFKFCTVHADRLEGTPKSPKED